MTTTYTELKTELRGAKKKRCTWPFIQRRIAKNECLLACRQLAVRYIIHLRDTKFSRAADQTLRRKRAKVVKIGSQAHRMQAHVERFIKTLRNEVLDHFIIFGRTHVDSLLNTFLTYYHRARPHQGKGNQVLVKSKSRRKVKPADTTCLANVRTRRRSWMSCDHSPSMNTSNLPARTACVRTS